MLQAMLRALGRPLVLARQTHTRTGAPLSEQARKSAAHLKCELASAAEWLARRLTAFGVREARRSIWRKASGGLHAARTDAAIWSRRLIFACRQCAARLCTLFQTARTIEDRATSRLACGILRTLEKELWLLQSNARSAPVALLD